MRHLFFAAAAALVLAGSAARADTPPSKVIDVNALVIKPVDTATSLTGKTIQFFSRVTASTLDNNGLLRTVNNLFGTKAQATPTQSGLSPLPDPSTYPSTYYKSVIQPAYPKYQTLPGK